MTVLDLAVWESNNDGEDTIISGLIETKKDDQ